MKKLSLLLSLLSFCAFGQENPKYRRLQLHGGIGHSQLLDHHFAPMPYTGDQLHFGLQSFWQRENANQFYIKLSANTGGLMPANSEWLESSEVQFRLSSSYQWALLKGKSWSWNLGPEYFIEMQLIQWQDKHALSEAYSYQQQQSLALATSLSYQIKAWRLETAISLGLISLQSRPPFNGLADSEEESLLVNLFQDLQVKDPWNNQNLSGRSAIYYRLSPRVELGALHSWQINCLVESPEYRRSNQNFSLALNFLFR